jgi:hypothetical protein
LCHPGPVFSGIVRQAQGEIPILMSYAYINILHEYCLSVSLCIKLIGMTGKRLYKCPDVDVAFIDRECLSTAGQVPFHTHFWVWVYLKLCVRVKLDSVLCSFTSISFLTNRIMTKYVDRTFWGISKRQLSHLADIYMTLLIGDIDILCWKYKVIQSQYIQ